jgi:beta-D-xylosidase 4
VLPRSEALHGVAWTGPGVSFADSGDFSFATSFPQPIVLGAAFDDDLTKAVATVISTEARAFNNVQRAGLDYFTPNINRKSLASLFLVNTLKLVENSVERP